MSAKRRMLAGFAAANLIVIAAVAFSLATRNAAPPLIQGILLPQARPLAEFRLIDHHNQTFSNLELNGRWHLVSYGFTTCPDICPTTLSQLAVLVDDLQEKGMDDLQILFYTVDHRRDTVEQMASYAPYFNPGFLGLTHRDEVDNPHLPFEQSLGIMSQLVPLIGVEYDPADNEYQVNHGVTLFLLNPDGQLQAIFEPDSLAPGRHSFDPDTLLRDYLAVRDYLG